MIHDTGLRNDFLGVIPKAQAKKQNGQVGLHKTNKLLHNKGNNDEN
jgi:hypothetical protein